MTLRTVVAADSPDVFFYFDETSGGFANHGSTGGSSTNTGNITYSQTAATRVGQGTAVEFNPTAITNASIGGGTYVSGTTWTFETWVKRATMTNPWVRIVGNFAAGSTPSSATDYAEIAIVDDSATAVTGTLRLYDQASGTQVAFAHATISDLNWHHIAVVNNAGSVTLYVDGVSLGTGTMTCASKTGTFLAGTRSVAGTAFYLDEMAFFKSALSATKILAHYGDTKPAAVPMNMGPITDPAPAIGIDKTSLAVPMTLSMDDVAPTLSTDKYLPAPPMTLSLAMPNVTPGTDAPPISAPPMTLSLATPAPTFAYIQRFAVTADGYYNSSSNVSGTDTEIVITEGNAGSGYLQFGGFSLQSGYSIGKATVNVYCTADGGQSMSPTAVTKIITSWTESSLATPPTRDTATTYATFTPSVGSWSSFDITTLAQGWATGSITNYGIALKVAGNTSANVERFYAREYNSGQYAAYMDVQLVKSQDATNSVPPMALSSANPNVTLALTANPTVAVPPAVISLADVAPVIGIYNPDYTAQPSPITLSLAMPNVSAFFEVDVTVAVPATYFGNLENEILTINTVTNITVLPQPFSLTGLRMVGIYNALADRYHNIIPSTIDADDVWYKMLENAGATRAVDYAIDATAPTGSVVQEQDGYYFGSPTFGVPGPQLRTAVNFDGVKDYLIVGPYSTDDSGFYSNINTLHNGGMALTVEFSIRTTQLNGTIFNAQGGQDGALAAISQTVYPWPSVNGNKVVLNNGYINIVEGYGNGQTLKAKTGFIADGQWHHIVLSFPVTVNNTTQFLDSVPNTFLMVDGIPTIVRKEGFGSTGYRWVPFSFMADSDFNKVVVDVSKGTVKPGPGKNVQGFLAGDLSEVIVRLNSALDERTAESVYYEWSDSSVVAAPPITVSLAMPKVTAKSNMKKMLAVYGLGWGYESNTGFPIDTYLSTLSGFIIDHLSDGNFGLGPEWPNVVRADSSSIPSAYYWQPVAFRLNEELMVYPVSIRGDYKIQNRGLSSITGLISPDASTDSSGYFVDDSTGLPRFINLQDDLAVDVTDFDVLTVVNYPWIDPEKGIDQHDNAGVSSVYPLDGQLDQHRMGLTDVEWEEARDALRDSILEAAYDGVSLWIGEAHMAQNLGFIQGFDVHTIGYELYGKTDDLSVLLGINNGILEDERAQILDRQFLNYNNSAVTGNGYNDWLYHGYNDPAVVGAVLGRGGTYRHGGQVNAFRRVAALVPGLTDLPAYDLTPQQVEGFGWNRWQPNGDFFAYNIQKRPSGYQIGDYTETDVVFLHSEFHGNYGIPDGDTGNNKLYPSGDHTRRSVVISAKPQGIVGTVVNHEVDGYWGPATVQGDGGTWFANPYANNAVTIAAEAGSIVRGRPIKGRAFMEFMETSIKPFAIAEDTNKLLWMGDSPTDGHTQMSFWDYDSRRRKEIKIVNNATQLALPEAGQSGGITVSTIMTQYLVEYAMSYNFYFHYGWHMKGLHWLGQTPVVDLNDTIVYASAITLPVSIPTPVITTEKNVTAQAPAMYVYLEGRVPANYPGPDVSEIALPIQLELRFGGIGSSNSVPPMAVSLSGVTPRVLGDVDLVTVFVDSGTSITLYLKEND